MNSRTAGRLIAAPFVFVGVRLATHYIPHAPAWVRVPVEVLGNVMLAALGLLMLGCLLGILFPRLGARLFPWSAAAQRRAGREPRTPPHYIQRRR